MKPKATCSLLSCSLIVLLVVLGFFLTFTATAQNLWTEIPLPVTSTNLSISFADSGHGCLWSSDGVFLYTSDGGGMWSVDTIPSYATKCALVSSNVVWCYRFGGATPGQATFFRSSDGGRTWVRKYYPDTLVVLGADFISKDFAQFITPTFSWATTDAGDSWHRRGKLLRGWNISLHYPREVEFFDELVGYVGGTYDLVGSDLLPQETTDGGFTWTHGYVGVRGIGSGVINQGSRPQRFSGGRGCTFAFGWFDELPAQPYGGLVLSWNRLQDTVLIGPRMNFFSPWAYSTGSALNRQNIWLLRGESDGRLLRTTNGGTLWAIDTLPVPISDIVYDLDGHRFALGRGRLFRWNDPTLGINPSQGYPASYALSQNYPNPFNPVTSFQFSIVNRQLTILKVYDVLGREVATLVNEVKLPGTYTMQWDASRQASGVYFYRLNAGSFVQRRKMLLLK